MAPALEDGWSAEARATVLTTDGGAAAAVDEPEILDRVKALYAEGLFLRAFELSRPLGPLETWRSAPARVMAGRLVMQLGGSRLALAIHARAWRREPAHPEARYYHAFVLLLRQGPLRAWSFLRRIGAMDDAPATLRSDWLALHGAILGRLRDFDAAESWLARAEQVAPGRPWLWVERADLFELEDRYGDALAAARQALAIRPWYPPAVQVTAHLLQLLDRDEEALSLLTEAVERIESSPLAAQLGVLQSEMGRYADASRTWDRFVELSPLLDERGRQWLAGRRSDTAYARGDVAEAARQARAAGDGFFKTMAERLEAPDPDTRRVVLDVGFVRQHHQTCAPATLAALARFWRRPVDHLEIAEAICYDGTPDHQQRSWAEANGWVVREFTVTLPGATALLDRGVPFALTTVGTQTAHLQAVIGYDARRGTFLIRDPTLPYEGEALADELLKSCRSVGPKGFVMVPREEAARLEGLDLAEVELLDRLHALQVALREHDRERAAKAHEALRAAADGHRLELQARLALAVYDADASGLLRALEELLKLFPEDVNFRIGQLSCLRELGRRDDRLAVFAQCCEGSKADPILQRQYAQELLVDAREHARTVRLARRVLRVRPTDAITVWVLGQTAWEAGERERAVELYRFASCLDDKDEHLARTYMSAARHLNQSDSAVALSRGRFRRYASRSAHPARTLFGALLELERREEAFAVLDQALALRPDDGELLRFIAEAHAAHGEFDKAQARLDAARGRCRQGDWLRAAAFLASSQGDLVQSLSLWRQVLDAEPMALDANQMVARRLAETRGLAATLEHLAAVCDRFPYNHALHQTWVLWLREGEPAAVETVVRRLLTFHPADAWARRELAGALSRQGRHDEALAEMSRASALDPASHAEACVRGLVLERAGRISEARAAYQEAIRRSADDDLAVARLMDTCDSRAERVADLAFIASELKRQVILGDGLLAFAHRARGSLEPDELLATLRAARQARPDLWHAWSAQISELEHRGELDEAVELARLAVERFPLLAAVWLDLSTVCRARGDAAGEIEALERALRLQPGWSMAARRRADVFEKAGNYAESCAVLERAVAHTPLDPANHGCLADALWHLNRKDEAVERLLQALRLEPGYEWAWETLREWSEKLKRPELPLNLARELTEQRGGEARSWLKLARVLSGPDALAERLAAIDRAIALDPRQFEPYDLKAEVLAEAGRFEDASAACDAEVWGDRPPVSLRGRAAWVVARGGDLSDAIDRMRAVLAEDGDYYWGWWNLAEWCRDRDRPDEYLKAAEEMVRLAPDSPHAVSCRGNARRRSGDRAGAKADFRRASDMSPAYGYAVFQLFDLEVEDWNFKAAAQVLEVLRAHHDGPHVAVRTVRLAAERKDRATAIEALDRLCTRSAEVDECLLRAADDAFTLARWARRAERVYLAALDRTDVDPLVATLWIEHWVKRPHLGLPPQMGDLLARGEVGRRAAAAYLEWLGLKKARARLRVFLRRYQQSLAADTRCWGAVGYALLKVGKRRKVVQWMDDWPRRDDSQPWMLLNLVYALRADHRDRAANLVSRRALELAPDHCTAYHVLWLALDELLDDQVNEAHSRFDKLDQASLGVSFDTSKSYLYRLVRILLQLADARPSVPRTMRRKASRDLVALNRELAFKADIHAAILHAYRRAVRWMARDYGPVRRMFWVLSRELTGPLKRR